MVGAATTNIWRNKMRTVILSALLIACGGSATDTAKGGDTASADGCVGLCTGAGFTGGTETDYGGGLVECVCEGTGGAVTQDACTDYCSDFGVDAANSLLGEDVSPNDKCVCDGTGG